MNSLRLAPLRSAALRTPFRASTPIVRNTILQQARALQRTRLYHATTVLRRQKEDTHSAHTISQRIRQLKQMPAELIPLFIVILFAVFAAAFALVRKLFTDKTLRLTKSRKNATPKAAEAH